MTCIQNVSIIKVEKYWHQNILKSKSTHYADWPFQNDIYVLIINIDALMCLSKLVNVQLVIISLIIYSHCISVPLID